VRTVGGMQFESSREEEGDRGTNENTPLLRSPPATPPPPHLSSSSSSNPSSHKTLGWIIAFLFLLNIATLSLGYYSYQLLSSHFTSQEQRIENLNTEYQDKLSHYEIVHNLTLIRIEQIENNLDLRLSYLEHIPSNDNVLEELHSTEQAMFNEIDSEKIWVGMMIQGIRTNVSYSINRSNRLVDKKLEEVEMRLQSSEAHLSAFVQETAENVTGSVEMAEKHIEMIDQNLTSQMTSMTVSVDNALTAVRRMVEEAKVDINEEVSAVHESMDQYIIFSNNQFAAENDFVKYQLAGPSPSSPLSPSPLSLPLPYVSLPPPLSLSLSVSLSPSSHSLLSPQAPSLSWRVSSVSGTSPPTPGTSAAWRSRSASWRSCGWFRSTPSPRGSRWSSLRLSLTSV
jgi:hypothetical protein